MTTSKAMKQKRMEGITIELEVPEGVTASVEGRTIKIKGPQGEISKKIESRLLEAKTDGKKITLSTSKNRKKQRALANTERGNVLNMIRGVTEKITYKLRILYSHFPMSVKLQGKELLIDNFLGEKYPRKAAILDGAQLEVKGQDVIITGIDKNVVAQTAANIEQATRIKRLDPRVFQDGIYLVEKDGRPLK